MTDLYESHMYLYISKDGYSVELNLDTSKSVYSEWIENEGADIGLLRCQETHRVVGCILPLLNNKLSVWHDGPLKINEGFVSHE